MAKDVKFGIDARAKMIDGVNVLANAVKVDGEELLIMKESDVLGVIEG